MTGFVTSPTPGFTGILNPLSRITIQSLGDIGYAVNAADADSYVIPGFGISSIRGQLNTGPPASEWEELVTPRMLASPVGNVMVIR
jgi:hypothetical protein